jgi:hypothetical protein
MINSPSANRNASIGVTAPIPEMLVDERRIDVHRGAVSHPTVITANAPSSTPRKPQDRPQVGTTAADPVVS